MGFDILQNLKDARTAFNGIVEVKNQVRRIFQNDVTRQFSLQGRTMRFQFIDHARPRCRAENAYENVRAFQVRRYIDIVNTDQHAFEVYFARNDGAQLTFHELVYAELAMFHWSVVGRFCETHAPDTDALQFLRDRFKLIALDDIADLIFAEVAELNPAFQT